jgi:hypothetical protein
MADIFSVAGLTAIPAIILLVVGLVVAFFGKTLFKVVVFLLGAIAGGALAGMLVAWLFPGSMICLLAGVVIAAIIGGYLALTIVKGILALAVGGIFAWIAAAVTPNMIVVLIAFIVGFVLALVLMDRLLGAITGVAGGAMAGFAITGFVAGSTGQMAGLVVGIIVALAGIYYQNWKHKGDLSRPDKDEKK